MSILLKEGRKEDLKKKYSDKFDDEVLDDVLGISDLQDFNHKYTDFILKALDIHSDIDMMVDVAVGLVKDFDKYQSQLKKKDINQYNSFTELDTALKPFIEKEKEKELEKQANKIYEDDKFLVIKPETEEASCKYGSNTKWCVTQKGSGHFERYTKGNQALYFIIDKKNSTDREFSKVAVHFSNRGDITYWDSQDKSLTEKEIKILKYAFPEVINSIIEDNKKNSLSNVDKFLTETFNNFGTNESEERNYLKSGQTLKVIVSGFENITDLGFGHSQGKVKIYISDHLIDEYIIYLNYKLVKNEVQSFKSFQVEISFQGNEEYIPVDYFMDLGLEDWNINEIYRFTEEDPSYTSFGVRRNIVNKILFHIKNNPKLVQKVAGTTKVWNPNRISYGYTFGKNKGLIKKLVDWLDNDNTVGTKLDFLVDIGKLERKNDDNNNPIYRIKGTNHSWRTSGDLRGHFAGFFASAKNAGILNYRKSGGKYLLVQGPNFDAFKKGELKAL